MQIQFSIKSNALHMKIFPNTSFGNFHALIDSCWKSEDSYCFLAFLWNLKYTLRQVFGTFHCFKCEACIYRANLLEVLKNHINNIHESRFWILPKASFGISNNFDLIMHKDIWIWWKDGEPYVFENLNYSQRQVLVLQMILHVNFALVLSKCKVCINKSNSLGALKYHIYCNHA